VLRATRAGHGGQNVGEAQMAGSVASGSVDKRASRASPCQLTLVCANAGRRRSVRAPLGWIWGLGPWGCWRGSPWPMPSEPARPGESLPARAHRAHVSSGAPQL